MEIPAQSTAALIIPALNEEPCIAATLRGLPPGLFRQVIVADNGSTDKTSEIAKGLGATVVYQPERGYGAACLKALDAVLPGTTAVVFLQADASEDPSQAPLLLQPIYDGHADLVLGSRTLGQAEKGALLPHQRLGNFIAITGVRLRWGHRYTDLGPFRAIRLDSIRALGMRDHNYGWTLEMQILALKHRLRVLEVAVSYRKRLAGQNKVSGNLRASFMAGLKILWTLWRLR